jgi:uncharacterized protein (DUF362 family)
MKCDRTMNRRQFLSRAAAVSAAVAGAGLGLCCAPAAEIAAPVSRRKSRVVIIRHDALAAEEKGPTHAQVRSLLDEAARALAGDAKAADAWARWFKPGDRLGIKVNCLGYSTRAALALGLVSAVEAIGLAPQEAVIWDRSNRELKAAGYDLRDAAKAPRCFGTDALSARGSGGYTQDVLTSGSIGSLFSRIVTDETTALVSASVLKDHNIAGLTGVLKNFFGAIHNPNKYHDTGCDPFVADVCAAQPIRDRLRLAVCDAMRPQYQGGPSVRPHWQWPYGGLILGTDPVAVDRVGLEIIAKKRAAAGMPTLEAERRPVRHLASAQARGLGAADLEHIEVVSIGKPWLDVG